MRNILFLKFLSQTDNVIHDKERLGKCSRQKKAKGMKQLTVISILDWILNWRIKTSIKDNIGLSDKLRIWRID